MIELHVDHYIVDDGGDIHGYTGPQLVVIAHAKKLVTIHEHGRQLDELAADRMVALLDLALAACQEPETAGGGVDTALSRPITSYSLHVHRMLREQRATTTLSVNHYAPWPIGRAVSTFLAALREATGPLPATAARAWDLAATWMTARDLGPSFAARQVVPLPSIVQTFSCDDTVYFRAGQRPQRSELYRLDPGQLVWLRDDGAPLPIASVEGQRWALPCGAGVIEVHQEWQQARRIYVRIDDPERGIWVQRGD